MDALGLLFWRAKKIKHRLRCFKELKNNIERRADEIVETVCAETKKPKTEALLGEVMTVYRLINFYLKTAPRVLKPKKVKSFFWANKKIVVHREPLGMVGVISPWNYPFSLAMGAILPALVTGNGVVFRPSQKTQKTGELIADLIEESGLDDAFELRIGDHSVVTEMIADPIMDKICFTGSVETGREVYKKNIEHRFTPPVLELGGSNAAIVCSDADILKAAKSIVWGRFSNAGQSCNAIKRVIAEASIFNQLVSAIVSELQKLLPEVEIPQVLDVNQHLILQSQLSRAIYSGARTLYQAPIISNSIWFTPTVMEVNADNPLWKEEVFGPILAICRVDFQGCESDVRDMDLGALMKILKTEASQFNLGTSVFTKNKIFFEIISVLSDVGIVNHNDALTEFAMVEAPFGSASCGVGFMHGEESLLEFTRPKTIITERWPMPRFWQYPYSEEKYNKLRKWIFWLAKIFK